MRFFKTIGSLSCVAALLCSYGFSGATRTATYSHKETSVDGGSVNTTASHVGNLTGTSGNYTGTNFNREGNRESYTDGTFNFSGSNGGAAQIEIYGDRSTATGYVDRPTNPITGNTFDAFNQTTPYAGKGSFGSVSYDEANTTFDITGKNGGTYDLYNPNWVYNQTPSSDPRARTESFKDVYEYDLTQNPNGFGTTTGTLTLYNPTTGQMETATSTTTRTYQGTPDDYDINTTQAWEQGN